MFSAASFWYFLVISLAQSELSSSSSIGNPRNHPSGILRRHRIKMQPKELVEECLHCQPWPTPADLDVHNLTQLIGGTLDGNLVSVTKPTDFAFSSRLKLRTKTKALRELVVNSTRKMNINGGTLTKHQQIFLVSWLKSFSSCTLRRVWRDMGPFSWPRYIKRAYCESKRCSLVPTMQCEPSSRQFFTVLRWFCLPFQRFPQGVKRKNVNGRDFWCHWVSYEHPITTGCSCGCQS